MSEPAAKPAQGFYHPPAPGKDCGACSLCCKAPPIAELRKPAGQWCRHIVPGVGCGVYETRPTACRVFNCGWLTDPEMADDWKPDVSGFVIFHRHDHNVWVSVDPDRPEAWKQARYHQPLRKFAARLLSEKAMLTVHVGARTIVVLPDGDVDVGVVPNGHRVVVGSKTENGQTLYQVRVQKAGTTG
jgi:hypothetical protein